MYQRLLVPVTAVILGCGGGPSKPPAPPRNLTVSTDLVSFALRNGTRVLLASDTTTDLVHVAARYDVGAIDDPAGKHGLAHLAEHLVFLSRHEGRRLDSRLSDSALGYNAYTTLDVTHYYSNARASELSSLLEVEALRIAPGACNSIAPDDFAREREVVLNELRTRHRRGDVMPLLLDAIYPASHPYHRSVGGSEADVSTITQDDVCAFVAQYYVPAQLTIVVTGSATKSQLEAALQRTIGESPGRPPVARKRPAPVGKRGARTVKAPVDTAQVFLLWPLPSMFTDARAAADLALELLSRRLDDDLSADHARSSAVGILGGKFAPFAVVAVELTKPEHAAKVLAAVQQTATKLRDKSWESELLAVHQRSVTDLIREFDSLSGRADRFADYLQLADGQHGYFIEDLERTDGVSRESLAAAARTVFDPDEATTLVVLPDETDEDYQPVDITFSSDMSHEASGHEIPVDPAEARAPLKVPFSRSRLHQARHVVLDNGLEAYLLPSSAVPIVDVRLQFHAGSSDEPENQLGVATVAGRHLQLARAGLTFSEANDALNFYRVGGGLDVSVDDDDTTFRAVGLEGYSDVLLAGLEHLVDSGRYDPASLDERHKRITETSALADAVAAEARLRALTRAVYGDRHPYATRGFASAEAATKIDAGMAQAFRKRYFVASNATLIITGKFDADLVEQHVRYLFGSWTRGTSNNREVPAGATSGRRFGVVAKPGPTVSIDIAYPTPAPGKDYAAWLVLEAMMGGQVTGVREEMGASYGMSAGLATNRGPGMLRVGGPVDRRRAGAALTAVRAAIDDLRQGGEDFDIAFALARRTVTAQLAATTNSASSTGAQLSFTASQGKLPSYLSHLVQQVASLTPAEVRALATRALAPERQSIVLRGERASVEAAFSEAGITDATIIDR